MTRFGDLTRTEREQVEALLRDCHLLPAGRDTELLFVRDGPRVIGCVGFEVYGPHGLLRSLAVDPCRRRSGHGRGLIRAALAALSACNVDDVWLLTHDCGPLFAEFGFEPSPREHVPRQLATSAEFVADECRRASCMRLSMTA